MSRKCERSLYVATDPNNNVPIGIPGSGISIGFLGPKIYDAGAFSIPADGSTVQIAANPTSKVADYNLDGTTSLAALTLNFAPGWLVGPDQQVITITFGPAVAALTFTGATFGGSALPTSATAGQQIAFVWVNSTTSWNRYL